MFIFLIITFLLPLLSLYLQTLMEDTAVRFVLYGIQAASPSIAGIIVTVSKNNVKNFFKENFQTGKMISAILLPTMIASIAIFPAKFIWCSTTGDYHLVSNLSAAQAIIILWAFIAEEIGWRGYLQPLLSKYLKYPSLAPLIVGVIWCFWHYHFYLFDEMQVPFLLFFTGCIVESYIYQYLLKFTNNNLLSAMIYHLTWNLGIHLFGVNPIDNMGSVIPYTIVIGIEIVILLFFMAGSRLRASERIPSR